MVAFEIDNRRYRYASNEHEGDGTYSLETIKYSDRGQAAVD